MRVGGAHMVVRLRKCAISGLFHPLSFSPMLFFFLGLFVTLGTVGGYPGDGSFGYFPEVNRAADCYALNETECPTPRCQPQIATVNACTKVSSCPNVSLCTSITTQNSCVQSGLCSWTASSGGDGDGTSGTCAVIACPLLTQALCSTAACCQWTATEFQCTESKYDVAYAIMQ